MKFYTRVISMVVFFVMGILSHSISQTNQIQSDVNPHEIKELEKTLKKISHKERTRLFDQIVDDENKKLDTKKDDELESEDVEKDSLIVDTTREELSFYQNLAQGNIVEPDELLKTLEVFGHTVFKKKKSPNFSPNKNVSVPADYPVSPGDEINIVMWGIINEELFLTVDRDGNINVPRIGPIAVAGLQFKDVQKNVKNRIENIKGVRASISMGTLSDMRIFVIGEVTIPGQYSMNALTNVTNALFYADGFTKQGSMRNVKLVRNGTTLATFDFYDFLFSGNNFSDNRLQSGDVILVPVVKKMVAVVGNVRRSALYEIQDNTTLPGAISLAGGLTPTAWVNRIQVERFQKNKQQVVFDIKGTSIGRIPQFKVQDADIIKIFPVIVFDKNAVSLSGNVLRPGKYEYSKKMKVSDLIKKYENLKAETYFDYAVIRRKEPPSFAPRIISFNLGAIFKDNNSEENKLLKPRDEIIIYHQDHFEPDRVVSIGGSVTKAGTYKLLENMRVKDLILESGGLSDKASEDRGELYKRIFHQDSVRTKKIEFSVSAAMDDDPEHNHLLSKFDHISIRQKRGWEDKKILTLNGEFVYPGSYIVLEGETLGELIRRAGGFKPEAYLSAAIYSRESVKEMEKQRNEEYVSRLESDILSLSKEQMSSDKLAILEQQKALLEKFRTIEVIGRIVVNFEDPKNYQHLEIEDGDILYLPKNHNTVSVLGEVFNASTFVLEHKKNNVHHYIQMAGGLKEEANKKDVYVIKANGSVRTKKMVRLSTYKLEPGDAVVVPLKIKTNNQRFQMFLATTKDLVAITTSSLLIATSIQTLKLNSDALKKINP